MWVRRVAVGTLLRPRADGLCISEASMLKPMPEAGVKQTVDLDFRPAAPPPLADDPQAGWDRARDLARRYLPNSVDLLAAVAFAHDSRAKLHTRILATRQLLEIADVVPQAPLAPFNVGLGNGGHE